MPVVRIHMAQALLARGDEAVGRVIEAVRASCTGALRAAPEQVQIMVLPISHVGAGAPVYIECQMREQAWRTPECLDDVMAVLDDAVRRDYGVAARIRCFLLPASGLAARN